MDFSGGTITLRSTMMIVALLALTTMNVVHGESLCNDDQDCGLEKYCYNVSGRCVDFTKCYRYKRIEASMPARLPSQCGPCQKGYQEELLGTGVPSSSCKPIKMILGTQQTEPEPTNGFTWPWLWAIGCISLAVILLISAIFWITKYVRTNGHTQIFEKVAFLSPARPTAPSQDAVSYQLRGSSYPDEERPPIYSSTIRNNVDRDQLVNATPNEVPKWVTKPNYDPDYNDNIADGVAMPIHASMTNIQIDLEDEGETNPSSWTPGPLTVNVPIRPFGRFAVEQQGNVLSSALVRRNCPANSAHEENTTSDDGSEGCDDPSGPRTQGGTFCGPNVQINQTITLNIAQSGTK